MSTPPTELIELLRRDGPESASGLARRLGVSTPTVTRALARLGDEVVSIGKGRASSYALRRPVRDIGHAWPLYCVSENREIKTLGTLESLYGRYPWRLISEHPLPLFLRADFANGLFEFLPWFLQALRPQGYIGRELVSFFADEIGAPEDISLWNDEDVLAGLLHFGTDAPGNLMIPSAEIGPDLLTELLDVFEEQGIREEDRLQNYSMLAEQTDASPTPGSSAAGEQPKFTAILGKLGCAMKPVIVKFASMVPDNPAAQRWADLLLCEEIALHTLSAQGIAAAECEIVDGSQWRFLQSTRFDRTAQGGRIGVFALDALDMAYVGSDQRNWLSGAEPLHAQGMIDAEDLERIRFLDAFGRCIGNDDMHHGNLSFFAEPEDARLRLAPVYDMLPMHYRPSPIGLVRDAPFALPTPDAERIAMWRRVATLAEAYWSRAAADGRLSPAFAGICRDNVTRIAEWRRQYGI